MLGSHRSVGSPVCLYGCFQRRRHQRPPTARHLGFSSPDSRPPDFPPLRRFGYVGKARRTGAIVPSSRRHGMVVRPMSDGGKDSDDPQDPLGNVSK